MYNITGEDVTAEPQFIQGLINNLLSAENTECIVFDTNSLLNEITKENVTYCKDACYKGIDKLNEFYQSENPEITAICLMININSMLNKLSSIEKGKFTTLIEECKNKGNVKFIIIDNIDVIKSINFEPWYKNSIDLAEGIWLGNDISNQFTLKVTTNARLLRAEVNPGFGYVIKKGKASLIKLMSDE